MNVTATMTGGASTMQALRDIAKRALRYSVAEVAKSLQTRIVLNLNGEILKTRSGKLKAGWSKPATITESGDRMTATLSGNVAYSRIHEYGGVIKPTKSTYLTIPVGRALTPTGQAKVTARMFIGDPKTLGYKRSFVLAGPRGKALCGVRGTKKNPVVEAVFLLRPQVTIPARHYLSKSIAQTLPKVPDIVAASTLRAKREIAGA